MGWLLVVDQGLPRYWATVWVALHGAALHESTLSAHLSVIESMYRSVQIQLNEDCLDRLCSGQPIPDSGLSFSRRGFSPKSVSGISRPLHLQLGVGP